MLPLPHRLCRHEADNPFSRFPLWKNALFPYVLRAQSVSPPKYVAVFSMHIIQLNDMVQPGPNGYAMALDRAVAEMGRGCDLTYMEVPTSRQGGSISLNLQTLLIAVLMSGGFC